MASLFGRGRFGEDLYSADGSASATVVVNMSLLVEAQRVKDASAAFSVAPSIEAFGSLVAGASSNIYALFGIDADPHRVRTVATAVPVDVQVQVAGDSVVDAKAGVYFALELVPRANYTTSVRSNIAVFMVIIARADLTEFWNDTTAPTVEWGAIADNETIWTPVNRERPFDA